jgi:hypothetical protein
MGTLHVQAAHTSLACARNYLITSGQGNIRIYNTSFYYNPNTLNSLEIPANSGQLESFRIQNGGSLFIVYNQLEARVYEILLPYKTSPNFDFGSARFVV